MADFIPPAKPLIGEEERAAVDRVLRSGMLAQGPEVAAFEVEFAAHFGLGRPCVAVNSGTSGLHLGLLAAGVGRGDEVIVPSFTFAATANAVALTGATPVFADIDPGTFCLDPGSVDDCGHGPDRGHPAGASLRPSGEHGRTAADRRPARAADLRGRGPGARRVPGRHPGRGVRLLRQRSRLYPTKNMTSGEGGMVSVAEPRPERLLRLYRNQGMERAYENEVVGFNNRMTDIHAAIGRVQLTKVAGWTSSAAEQRGLLDRRTSGVSRPRRSPTAPSMSSTSTRSGSPRTVMASPGPCDDEYGVGSGSFYPTPVHRLTPLSARRSTCRRPSAPPGSAFRCPFTPPSVPDDLERIVRGGQHAGQGRSLSVTRLRAG